MKLLMLFFIPVLLVSCGPSEAAGCRELVITCGDNTIASGECVREANILLTIPPQVRFTRCDGTTGTVTLEGGDCLVSKGKVCK